MKALLSTGFVFLLNIIAYGLGFPTVAVNGNSYSNISYVHLSGSGRVILLYPGGGASAAIDDLPADFLVSWNIKQTDLTKAKQAAAQAAQAALDRQTQATQATLDREISEGVFREVDGVVYNTMAPAAGWLTFQNVKLIQALDGGSIIDVTPDSPDYLTIYLKHAPEMSDQEYFTFTACPAGTFNFENKLGNGRTIRAFDYGRVVDRDETPASVLSGQKAFDTLATSGHPQTDVVATLPDSDNLTASGSGFFISTDGYLITNNHVVKNARKVKVKNSAGVFNAQVVRVDETNDLALLKVDGRFEPLNVPPGEVTLGDPVFTIGFPDIQLQGVQPKYTSGQISCLTGLGDDPDQYQISVPVQPGNSGGPLVDSVGSVKGVIVARLDDFAALKSVGSLPQNVNYAIKGSIVRSFIQAGGEVKLDDFVPDPGQGSPVPVVQRSVAMVLVY